MKIFREKLKQTHRFLWWRSAQTHQQTQVKIDVNQSSSPAFVVVFQRRNNRHRLRLSRELVFSVVCLPLQIYGLDQSSSAKLAVQTFLICCERETNPKLDFLWGRKKEKYKENGRAIETKTQNIKKKKKALLSYSVSVDGANTVHMFDASGQLLRLMRGVFAHG